MVEKNGWVLSPHTTLNNLVDNTVIRVVVLSENLMINCENIHATILHTSNGQEMDVELDDSLTVADIINELIACNFIEDTVNKRRYGTYIKNSQTEIRRT